MGFFTPHTSILESTGVLWLGNVHRFHGKTQAISYVQVPHWRSKQRKLNIKSVNKGVPSVEAPAEPITILVILISDLTRIVDMTPGFYR